MLILTFPKTGEASSHYTQSSAKYDKEYKCGTTIE